MKILPSLQKIFSLTLAMLPLSLDAASDPTAGYEWVKVTMNAGFCPRDGLGVLAHRGKMWVLGGWNPSDKVNIPRVCANDVWSSTDGKEWTEVKPNSYRDSSFDPRQDWEGRHTAGYVVFQDKMWIVGGDVNQGHYMYDVWHSTDGKKWTQANPDKPVPWGPRALHHTVVFKDKIWVMGGQTLPAFAPEEERFYRDIWTSADGSHWEQVVPQEPYWQERGMIGGQVVFKDRLWVLGGGTYDTAGRPVRAFYNDVWSTPDGVHWTLHTAKAPWAPRQYHEAAVFDGKMWVLEGYGTEAPSGAGAANRNDVWFSEDGVNWLELPDTPWKARHAAGIVVYDNALWIIAGNNMESDVWKLVRKTP